MRRLITVLVLLGLILGGMYAVVSKTDFWKADKKVLIQQEAQLFLDQYTKEYQRLYTASSEASWNLNTKIMPGDSTNAVNSRKADEAFAAFTGSKKNIEMARKYLADKDKLSDLQRRQFEKILFMAANNPETLSDIVKKRIKAETAQTEKLYGYTFTLNGKPVTPNDIDSILIHEKDPIKRLAAWNAAKEVGKELKGGLVNLRNLRNQTVQGLGYPDFFSYQVSEYHMTTQEMLDLNRKFLSEIWPLYRELHTYARYELAKRYGVKEVPDMLPAHWLPNRWGQDWSSMVDVKGLNLDSILKTKSPQWIVQQGENFYVSLGFPRLPQTFWEKSSLYPLPANSPFKKNTHASAWHIDLDKDVRSLMSVANNSEWYETVNHELGHIYYYMSYSNKDVPILMREGANRAYHEGFGTQIGLAAMQKPFLANNGLLPKNAQTDDMQILLKQALNSIVFLPFSAGVMTEFEYQIYNKNIPPDQFNKVWWDLVQKYQGITAPGQRGEQYCDAATKTHINDDPAQYYDYAISYILLYQFHDHIARHILHQDPHATNYYGSKEVGDFLRSIMYWGGSKDWREVLKNTTGSELSAKAMLNYFSPLMDYLKKENKGRKYTLPEKIQG